jgi:nitrite reductase (NO-forming)
VKPRSITALYQTTARAWLTAAALSLLLPPTARAGLWLPLHLALAGAIASAISGAMQNFVLALTATPPPGERLVLAQFALVTAGAASIAIGVPSSTAWLTAAGGTAFVAAMAILGWMLLRSWRRSLTRRHRLPIAAYGAAVAFVLLGGTFGALIGGQIASAELYVRLRHAHMTVNVLGFASLTVVGTLITLLPTVLRVRMPRWRGGIVLAALVAGVALQAFGWLSTWDGAVAAGGISFAAGALGVVWLVTSVLRVERSWAIPGAGVHLIAGVGWFVAGSLGLAGALFDGSAGFDRFRPYFLLAFVAGFLIQVLLGAWAYLLPMQRPGHPADRRRSLAAFELLMPLQVALLNGGLVILILVQAGWLAGQWDDVGTIAAFTGGAFALTKAWLFPLLGRGSVDTERARAIWGG